MNTHKQVTTENAITTASRGFTLDPPEGHEIRFASKLTALGGSMERERKSRRRNAFRLILTGAAAASLVWVLAYSFIINPPATPDPFESKMAMLDLCYRREITRMSEEILRSATTPEERTIAEECLKRFSEDQTEYERNVASTLPRSPEGVHIVEKHYHTCIMILRDLDRTIRTTSDEPSLLILK